MSISEQIARLQQLKERLRTKLTALKLASEENTLEECVAAVESIADNRAVSQKLDTTTASYTVPAGYHNGSGTVSVELEEKNRNYKRSSNSHGRQGAFKDNGQC